MSEGVHYLEKVLEFAFGRTKRDKDAARLVIAALNARDTVHAQTCNEHCRATYESVRGLREVVNAQVGKDISTELALAGNRLPRVHALNGADWPISKNDTEQESGNG
jgi:hypothetical protein